MDGSIPRIQGTRPTQSVRPVHRRRAEDGDGQTFEEKLDDHEDSEEHGDEHKPEREDLDIGVREDDEAGGSLDLTA